MAPFASDPLSKEPAPDVAIADALKLAMRRLATSVTVLSAIHAGRRYAMAATSVQSLSLSPPSVVACINQSASIYLPIVSGSRFCVNILSVSHVEIARACGGALRGEERLEVGDWRSANGQPPYLADAQVNLFCDCDGHLPYGTHGIFVGRIREIRMATEISPLLYADGSYRSVGTSLPT